MWPFTSIPSDIFITQCSSVFGYFSFHMGQHFARLFFLLWVACVRLFHVKVRRTLPAKSFIYLFILSLDNIYSYIYTSILICSPQKQLVTQIVCQVTLHIVDAFDRILVRIIFSLRLVQFGKNRMKIKDMFPAWHRSRRSASATISWWKHGRRRWSEWRTTPGERPRRAGRGSTTRGSSLRSESRGSSRSASRGNLLELLSTGSQSPAVFLLVIP